MATQTEVGAVVVGSGLASIVAALVTRRSVLARRYIPKVFDANHIPPQFSLTRDALHAIGDATMLATSGFVFLASSAWWIMGVGSFEDFGLHMQRKLGKFGPTQDTHRANAEDNAAVETLEKWLGAANK